MSMKTIVSLVLVLVNSYTESYPYLNGVLKTFSLEEVIPLTVEFYPEDLYVQWVSDNEYIIKDSINGVLKYSLDTNKYTEILDQQDIKNIGNFSLESSEPSPDLKFLLLVARRRKLYRYSSTGEYRVYDLVRKNLSRLGEGALQVVIWSKRQTIAYVKDNNVFYVPDVKRPDQVIQLTTDGVPGIIYHGVPDWLYEEEMFNAAEAMWFSNNGKYLAVASFNDKEVDTVEIPYYGKPSNLDNQYPETENLKFPKAGRKNPQVILRIFKLEAVGSEPWNIPAPVDLVGLDHYLGRVNWASDHNVIVLWLNRRQNVSVLVNCDLERDKCSIVIEHTEPNGWIDVTTPLLDKSGDRMVEIQNLYHGDQRFAHAAKFNFKTLTTEDLSPGNSTVTEIVGWNEEIDTVYYIVSPGNTPWMRQMWATSKGIVRCISCKQPACHSVTEASFSSSSKYAIIKCSSIYIPPKIYLYNTLEDKFSLIKENTRLKDLLKQYQLPYALFNVVSLGEHVLAHVKLLLPPNMASGAQYPMVVRVYAGPGSSRVTDHFDVEYYNSYLATNRSFIIASIDVRGSGYMGVEAMHAVNNALGSVEITDTLLAIKSLMSVYTFIDPTRIGVWGWSYGGFASTMMLIKDDERLLSCAAAVAPVTSWLYYDTMYTERYMDTPQANPSGYENSDIIKQAEKLRGRRYLLAHGTKDDNTHFQHSIQLAKQLQRSDIDFEQMSYADEEHSLLHVSRHFYHMLDRFWTRCFNKD